MKTILLTTTAIVLVTTLATAGLAQSVATAQTAHAQQLAATAPFNGPSSSIEEVVVTAERKTETSQKAALAIDVVSGASLANRGISNSLALGKVVPSLTLTNGGGAYTHLFMNGVGDTSNSSYLDPAIATSYDGIFLGRASGAFGAAFFDLARVEVLKGPQGILYGRNATGGAINIIANPPDLDRTSGEIDASYGNYNAVTAQGYFNLPVSDDAALRISASHQAHDGYNRDGTDDQDSNAVRAQFLYKPNDRLSMRLASDYTHIGGMGAGGTYLGWYKGKTFVPSNFDTSEGFGTAAANAYRTTQLGAPGFGKLSPLTALIHRT